MIFIPYFNPTKTLLNPYINPTKFSIGERAKMKILAFKFLY